METRKTRRSRRGHALRMQELYSHNKKTKIFVAYSKHDYKYLEEFEDHLVTLKNQSIVSFNCRKIDIGEDWNETIIKELNECDILICLVSVKFLTTDYIRKIEIPLAIKNDKKIVPIILKSCDWETTELGKYQAAQKGNIVSLNNDDLLLGRIKSKTQEEIDAFWTKIIKELRINLLK